MGKQIWKAVVPVLVAVVIALLPVPEGLTPNAWNYFALFAGVVIGLVVEPISAAAIGVFGVTLAATFHLVQPPPAKTFKTDAGKAGVAATDNAPKGESAVKAPAAPGSSDSKAATPPVPSPGKVNPARRRPPPRSRRVQPPPTRSDGRSAGSRTGRSGLSSSRTCWRWDTRRRVWDDGSGWSW